MSLLNIVGQTKQAISMCNFNMPPILIGIYFIIIIIIRAFYAFIRQKGERWGNDMQQSNKVPNNEHLKFFSHIL